MEGVKFERKIEILEHKVAVLEALCKDMRFTIEVQDRRKEEERAKRNELARKTKTLQSQALEICHSRSDNGGHNFISKEKVTTRGVVGVLRWKECSFCGEDELTRRKFYA